MIKFYGVLALLVIMMSMSQGQDDYLGGGYVGRGDYGDIGQYFTDPIFHSPGSAYTSPYSTIGSTQGSVYSPRKVAALGSTSDRYSARSTIDYTKGITTGYPSANVPSASTVNAGGHWHLDFSDGTSADLDLNQYGVRVFGRGSLTSAQGAQWIAASGSVSGSSVIMDLVPGSGISLYTMSLNTNSLQQPSSYTLFRAGAQPFSGTVRATRTT